MPKIIKTVNFTPGDYLFANVVFVILLVGSYLFVRKGPQQPMQLNLKQPSRPLPLAKMDEASVRAANSRSVHNPSSVEYRPRSSAEAKTASTKAHTPPSKAGGSDRSGTSEWSANGDEPLGNSVKDLNIHFQWNGHTWDAFEVLGLPAGSSLAAARSAYDRLVSTVAPESRPFIGAALAAIRDQRRKP